MKSHLIPCLKLTLLTMAVFGAGYPLLITGLAKIAGPNQGEGVQISNGRRIVGFEIIGQAFGSEQYFNGRPSAVGYNAASTGGSNKGPTNPEYLKQVEERIATLAAQNPEVKLKDIPVDLITASGGGLDPHISLRAAQIQVKRIAKARGVREEIIQQLILQNTERPLLGYFGTSTVHILKLNIALDNIK